MQPLRIASTARQMDEWALVLIAIGIPYSIEADDGGFVLLVPGDDMRRADLALTAYDHEAAHPVVVAPLVEPAPPYPWMSGVTVGLLLLAAFAITGSAAMRSRFFDRGAVVADRVVGNEPWRAVTALTLHVDLVHVVGNAAAVAVLLGPLAQRFGVGVALALTLLAGAGGNFLSSLVHAPGHAAVGASTATFGIIGALAALQLMAPPAPGMKPRRRFIVVGATLLLLTILGTAREADVVAHALGLAWGGVLGTGAGLLVRRRPSAFVQGAFALSAALAVAGAWRLALRTP